MALWLATLKSLLSVVGVTGGYPVPRPREGRLGGIVPDYTDPTVKTDMFERGAWWKNRVSSRTHPLNDVKRCGGDCRKYASRAYEDQMSVFRQTAVVSGVREPLTEPGPDRREATSASEDKKNAAEKKAQARRFIDENSLDSAERLLLAQFKLTDAAVRRHEQAHLTVAGSLARGGANYDYRKGPDGREYAVGGDVSIDVSKSRDPEKTINKMERVRAAALAPAVPSARDRSVAASASIAEMDARLELKEQEMVELEENKQRGGTIIPTRVSVSP